MPSLTGRNLFVTSCYSTGRYKKRGKRRDQLEVQKAKIKKGIGKNPRKEKEISWRFYNPPGIKPKESKPKTFA